MQVNKMTSALNIFGLPLELCNKDPLTGYTRKGYCELDDMDKGVHTVCAIVTADFLKYTYAQGNDLITPSVYFPGLKPGDQWCLCAYRWLESYYAGMAPLIKGRSTHISTLHIISPEILKRYLIDKI